MNTIKVDSNCISCKKCYQACWLDVIRWDEAADRPYAAYPEDCVDCNYCEISCPKDAIHVNVDFRKPMPKSY